MIGDSESDKSWIAALFGKFGALLKYIFKRVWEYSEHY